MHLSDIHGVQIRRTKALGLDSGALIARNEVNKGAVGKVHPTSLENL